MIDALTLSIDIEVAQWDDRCRQAADRGWSSVILQHCGEADAAACERLEVMARRAVDRGLTVRAVMLQPDARSGLGEPDPQRRSHAVDRIAEWLTRTDRIGGATLIVRVAALDRPGVSVTYQDTLNATAWSLNALRRPLECSDASLALIVASGGFLLSPPEARELIDLTDSPHVGVCVWMDSGMHLHTAEDWIQTLDRRLFAVHVSAEAVWSGVRNALVRSGFGGILSASASTVATPALPSLRT
ncbi:MAG: TIM barrel protein [Planctomycetes bacterium]|nr:TIM barrel protein [Planctomycetota bacterium]